MHRAMKPTEVGGSLIDYTKIIIRQLSKTLTNSLGSHAS